MAGAHLQEPARNGDGFNSPDHHPALVWIPCDVPQEYTRHVGRLDAVRALTGGVTGEWRSPAGADQVSKRFGPHRHERSPASR